MIFSNALLRRKNAVVVQHIEGLPARPQNFALVASLDANLRKLGYALSGELALSLVSGFAADIVELSDSLIPAVRQLVGAHRRYSPMYPNFPIQVMEAPAAELYINAIVHYFFSYGLTEPVLALPEYAKLARPELNFDESKVTFIKPVTVQGYYDFATALLGSKVSFGASEHDDIAEFPDYVLSHALQATELDNRENKAWLAALADKRLGGGYAIKFDTATDVLRYAVALSDGDVSLADKTEFVSFSRAKRREILGMLDAIGVIEEDMLRYRSAWKRLGERLHPGEFADRFPKAAQAFAAIRSNDSIETFNSRVERALAENNVLLAVTILKGRPGEFARRLDHVLRIGDSSEQDFVVSNFGAVAERVSPTVLLQTRNALLNRDSGDVRAFFPKGNVAKMITVKDERAEISNLRVLTAVRVIENALVKIFSEREPLGSCWIDPSIETIAIPFGIRSASKSLKTLGRGSRLPISEDTKILRFFIWWKGRDVDLSASVFGKDFKPLFDITYYNLREKGAVHSGDITYAPQGASEFIDIDIDKIVAQGGRYVLMNVNSYSGETFDSIEECFAGFMERRDLASGEVYEPRTVKDKVDLTAKSRAGTPFIFDLVTREAIWVDLTTTVRGFGGNVANTKGQLVSVLEAMTSLAPPTLHSLLALHVNARGSWAKDRESADTVFAVDGTVSPFDTDVLLSEYL